MGAAMFGRYELVRRLAGGGMGEVFAANMRGAEGFVKPVALKRIYPHLAGDPKHRALFVREAKLVAQLSHPNIVQVIDLGTERDELYMAMEFVQGVTLAHMLRTQRERGERLPPEVVIAIANDLLEALAYAHGYADDTANISGIVHADVSPQNVMITMQGRAKLCDFGVAKLLRSATYEATKRERWGKVAYMAPEQLAHNVVDARSDLYAVAVMMIEGLSGSKAFNGSSMAQVAHAIRIGEHLRLEGAVPGLPRELIAVIENAMAVDPARRYQSAEAMRRALIDALGSQALDDARARLGEMVQAQAREEPYADEPTGRGTMQVGGEKTVVSSREPQSMPSTRLRTTVVVATLAALVAFGAFVTWRRGSVEPTVAVAPETRDAFAPEADVRPAAAPDLAVAPTPVAEAPAPVPAPQPAPEPRAPVAKTRPEPAKSRKKSRDRDPAKADANEAPALLTLNSVPWAYVTVDGARLAKPTPLFDFALRPGHHVVELEAANGKTTRLSLNVASGEVVRRVVKLE